MCRLTTKNNFIKTDYNKAESFLRGYCDKNDPRYNFIYGLICLKKNKKMEAYEYFTIVQKNGCEDCDKYLRSSQKFFSGMKGSPNISSMDIVFMIDGTDSKNRFIKYDDLAYFCDNVLKFTFV